MKTLTSICMALVVVAVSATSHATTVLLPPVPADRGSEADYKRSLRSAADAQKQMNKKRWKKMLFHAETAWATYKSPTFALLQGIAHARLKNPQEAAKWLITARAMKPASEIVNAVDEEFAKVGPRVTMGMLSVNAPKGTTVKVDGTVVAHHVVGVVYGDHVVTATREGYKPFKAALPVKTSALETLSVSLEKLPEVKKAEPKPPTPPTPVVEDPPSIALPLGLIIGGVVVAGAGAGLHAWGLSADADADAMNGAWDGVTYEESRAQFDALRSDGETGAFAAYGLYALGGGLIIAGAIVWALQDTNDNEGTADVVLSPAIQRGGLTAAISGKF